MQTQGQIQEYVVICIYNYYYFTYGFHNFLFTKRVAFI